MQQRELTHWYLTISTWTGIAPGAVHFYGRIRTRDFKSEVNLEKADGDTGFATKGALIAAARRWFKQNKDPEKNILYLGHCAVIDPKEILAGPLDLKQLGNRLWGTFENLGGWERKENEARVQKICDEWDEVFKDES